MQDDEDEFITPRTFIERIENCERIHIGWVSQLPKEWGCCYATLVKVPSIHQPKVSRD